MTVREALLARADESRPALLVEDDTWTWREYVAESSRRANALAGLLDPGRPPHVGVLMDNTPEMVFTLGAAGLGGLVAVGLNTTRRGEALLADIRKADCQVVLVDPRLAPLLDGLDLGDVQVLVDGRGCLDLGGRLGLGLTARRRSRGRLAVHADLHLRHERRPQGGADHAREDHRPRAPT